MRVNLHEREVINLLLNEDLVDRYENDLDKAVDVIIPIYNTSPLFEKNLLSIYREIPVNRLLIGDGGSTDHSLDVLKKFPRVIILTYEKTTLGHRLRKLVENCETEYFIYLHADVMLTEGWFDTMYQYRKKSPWYESDRRMMAVITWETNQSKVFRPYSGSQFGTTSKMKKAVASIDDDYLFRNEDLIIGELAGIDTYLKITETFHYHQLVSAGREKEPSTVLSLDTPPRSSRPLKEDYEISTYTMQWKGLVKYCEPKDYLIEGVIASIKILRRLNAFNVEEATEWTMKHNEKWLPHVLYIPKISLINRIKRKIRNIF